MAPPESHASGFESGVSLGGAVRAASRRLQSASVDSAARDARLLVAAAAGVGEHELVLRPDMALAPQTMATLEAMLVRRTRQEPVSRILGFREFYGRRFKITPATLDPRPDSETLIEAVLDVVRDAGRQDGRLRIIDVGTGSGCLLLTLLSELPQAGGLGTDICPAALAIARGNAAALGLADRARFEQRRSLEGTCDTFDILISNPPYIPSREVETLEDTVRLFDPVSALDGGDDGLAIYREIAAGLLRFVPSGWAFFETGAGQAESVLSVLDAALARPAMTSRVWLDLDGRQRCVAVSTQF